MTKTNPLICTLSNTEFREREATLLAQFKTAVQKTEELANGYAFQFSGERKWLALVSEMIIAERECCPFLTFELAASPEMGPLTVRVTGPDGTKGFLKSLLL